MAVTAWWEGAAGYEVYVRSFADTTGDGFGDLAGVKSGLEYLAWLGVDVVWLTPFMPSPGLDHGYDVSDYCDVDPPLGSLDDFERLIGRAHDLGLRVLVDLVPNHTSSHHPWFQASCSSRTNEHRDWYIWADPAADGGPPNNWVSHFGGPAWTFEPTSGQYYCHLFLPEQPDLNWSNPEVRDAFDAILRFWCERGADGFRIDVAHSLLKDPDLTDNPRRHETPPGAGPGEVFESYDHTHDLDQDGNVEIYRRWRSVTGPYDALLIGEVNVSSPARSARYTAPGVLDKVFFLEPAWLSWDPVRLLGLLRSMHDADPDGVAWTMNSHDTSRSVTRFGGGEAGLRRSLAVTAFEFSLGGLPFLYQGEELGLDDGVLAPCDRADPIWTRNTSDEVGRDGARSAMPWRPGPANGFTTGRPWLPAAERPAEQTVEHQRSDPRAPLHAYRRLIAARRDHPELHGSPLDWIATGRPDAAAVRRGPLTVVANLSPTPLEFEVGAPYESVLSSWADPPDERGVTVRVPPETTVYVRSDR